MDFVCTFLQLYLLVLIVRIVLSWFPQPQGGALEGISNVLFALTEPVLRPFRGLLPPVQMGGMALDLSPLIVFLIIQILIAYIC